MKADFTDVTVVMDRSGSMSSCKKGAEEGLNGFIEKQKSDPGETNFTLCQFDTEYEFVHKAVPIKQVPRCELHPRGGTALLDAVGRAITETGSRPSTSPPSRRSSSSTANTVCVKAPGSSWMTNSGGHAHGLRTQLAHLASG